MASLDTGVTCLRRQEHVLCWITTLKPHWRDQDSAGAIPKWIFVTKCVRIDLSCNEVRSQLANLQKHSINSC